MHPSQMELANLSPRELEVITLITQGHSNAEIVETLGCGMNTVKSHVRSAYRKVGVVSRSQAVMWGCQHGLHG